MANKSKTGGRIGWIIFAIVAYVIYKNLFGDHDPDPNPPDTAQTTEESAASDDSTSGDDEEDEKDGTPYAEAALRDTWPPLKNSAGDASVGSATGAQSIASNYYVILDGSGSMRREDCSGDKPKIEVAVSALGKFIDAVPAEANIGLAVFDRGGLKEKVPLGLNNRAAIREALKGVQVSGGTPLKSSIELAADKLTEQARRQLGYGDYHLVMVTDGYADPSREDPTDAVAHLLDTSPIVLHTIGFCIGEDHVLNQPGRVYYTSADSPETLAQGLGSVLAEAPSFDVSSFPQK